MSGLPRLAWLSLPMAACAPVAAPAPAPPARDVALSAALLRAEPTASERERAWLGVSLEAQPRDRAGVRLSGVLRGSPAAAAGLVAGDVLLSVAGRSVQRPAQVLQLLGAARPGERLSLGVLHAGRPRLVRVTLGRFPETEELLQRSYVGQPAPRLEGKVVQGTLEPRLAALRGRVVVLEFWATWCRVCQLLAPRLDALQARWGPEGVVVLGVAQEPFPVVAASVAAQRLSFGVVTDESGDTAGRYGAFVVPSLYVLDRHGIVRDVLVGYSEARLRQLDGLLLELLREP